MEQNNLEKTEKKIIKTTRNRIIAVIALAVIILGGIGGLIYWNISSSRVYVENSIISAPVTNLSPTVGGTLQEDAWQSSFLLFSWIHSILKRLSHNYKQYYNLAKKSRKYYPLLRFHSLLYRRPKE